MWCVYRESFFIQGILDTRTLDSVYSFTNQQALLGNYDMNWYSKLPIKTKLVLSFGALIIFTLLITAASFVSMRGSQNAATYVHWTLEERYQRINRLSESARKFQNLIFVYSSTYAFNVREVELSEVQERAREFKRYADNLVPGNFPQQIGEIKEYASQVLHIFDSQIQPLVRAQDSKEALRVYAEEVMPNFSKMFANFNYVSNNMIKEVFKQMDGISDTTPMYVVLAIGAGAILFSIFIAMMTSAYIKGALFNVISNLEIIEKQDLSHPCNNPYYDEFGTLTASLETVRVKFASIVKNFINLADTLSSDLKNASNLTDRLEQHAADTESRTITVAAAANQMVSTTQEIARNCDTAATIAQTSADKTNEGTLKAKESINAIYEQSEQIKANGEQIEAMVEQSRSINSIVNTIDEIAAQTNLLALNAAIEAARAGEAGRGFAVVADEVRALASRTSSSTSEITSKVERMVFAANEANESMGKSVNGITSLADNTSLLDNVLTDVLHQVQDVNTQIGQIAAAAEEQSTASHEISMSMQELTNITREVSEAAENTSNVVNNSFKQIESLTAQIKEFKV